MSRDRLCVVRRVAGAIRQQEPVDVYKVVEQLQAELPNVPGDVLLHDVEDEIAKARCSAIWEKRER